VKQVGVPWARPGSGVTLLFEAFVLALVRQMPVAAAEFLKRWYFWATHSRLDPMIRIAKTLKKHWDDLLSWFHSHISNGILEGINSLIQAAKAKDRGYRTTRDLITMLYLIAGKLNLESPI
jgi:transposase